ncbi:PQQ-binding-like beta-propeller repeat protein [Streptomyces sp. CWNU-52B]|uniref:outer membrane protein assembly factor BamB family protein n=1 Tax=unclassified Streptomyces TaxID=2593676 RepID=UPI0039BF5AEC
MRTCTEAGGLLMRRPAARAAGALALFAPLLVLAACTGSGDRGGAGGAEDRKALSAARADAFETAWSYSVRGEPGEPTVTDDVVLAPHGHMIDVRDARTGENRRTVRAADPADRIVSAGLTGEVIVAGVERGSYATLRGFGLRTGRQLWSEPYWERTAAIVQPGDERELPVLGPVVVNERGIVVHAHDGRTVGLDPGTGRPVWQRQPECDSAPYTDPATARIHTVAATGRYLITLCSGGPRTVLKAVDPRDGDRVWQEDLASLGGRTTFSTAEDVIGVQSQDAGIRKASFTLLDESGHRLGGGTVQDPAGDSRTVGRVGDTVYFHDGRQLRAVGAADGSPLWHQDAPGDLVVSDRAVISNGEALTPERVQRTGVSVVLDLSGKRRVMLPWPLRGELVGLSGEFPVIRSREENGARYTALRLAHQGLAEPALGGVPASDWPDACSLLSAEQLDGLGEGYLRLPVDTSRTAFGVRLPHATECRFATGSGSAKDIFQITVRWVAADADAARRIAASDLPWDTGAERLDRGAHLVPDASGGSRLMGETAMVASGRAVLGISAPKNAGLVRTIALLLSGNSG